jgi:hypothetical protein
MALVTNSSRKAVIYKYGGTERTVPARRRIEVSEDEGNYLILLNLANIAVGTPVLQTQ